MGQNDTTLGGYLRVHDRPPAYEGSDGHPYTVSIETEKTPKLSAPVAGFLVFPRWAQTGVGIVGHVETPTLVEARSAQDAEESLGELSLLEVRDLLEQAIGRRTSPPDGPPIGGPTANPGEAPAGGATAPPAEGGAAPPAGGGPAPPADGGPAPADRRLDAPDTGAVDG